MRIAGRDLLGVADLRTVGAELAGVADACLHVALGIAAPAVPIAVIGMGKLGGNELNYASDVDVVFVHDGDSAEAERAARAVMRAMTEPTRDGIVFRTDADLRPEGRSGALSRTLGSYSTYWQRWAQTVGVAGADQGPAGRRRSRPRRRVRRRRRHRSCGPTSSTRPRCTKSGP